jgi:mannose-1-phosphate guanylyltransferase
MLHALIMAGGGGTRFWPRSRQSKPKQFLALTGARTLLQQTVERIEALVPPKRTWVITAQAHVEETARQLPQLPRERIIGEPCGRDTAPCIAVGAALIRQVDPDAVMAVMAADHVIEPAQELRRAVQVAELTVIDNPSALVTIGITPTFAATGYGYIERGPEVARRQGIGVHRVQAFREKPRPEVAREFVESGRYAWNSGMFFWRADTILGAMRASRPAIVQASERIAQVWPTAQRDTVLAADYPGMERVSIDFAVMEKAIPQGTPVFVVEAPFRWDDVGSWLALERMNPQDAEHNTVLGQHCGEDTHGCIVVGDPGKLIATAGVKDLIIIQDGDCILVADRNKEGSIKQLVEALRRRGLEKYL